MGVCEESEWKYQMNNKGKLTIRRAKNARSHTVGAYYRISPEISHFHAAINEVGIIAVSANVHKGWDDPSNGIIKFHSKNDGGHAFAIIGYNDKGFWIQNSWGETWGKKGLALWTYEDWNKNIMDAWVFRLALPTPQLFGLKPAVADTKPETGKTAKNSPDRSIIAGHFVHIDDGRYKESGRYWSTADDIDQTAKHVAECDSYKHLLIYAHGGLNSPEDSANRIAGMKNVYKDNGIYPFHIMYDTGLVEELKDLILHKDRQTEKRVGGFSDWSDRFLEGLLRRPGTLLWDEMKRDADDAFKANGAGTDAIKRFLGHFDKAGTKIKLHIAGHSTGGIVLAHLLDVLQKKSINFSSCSLMAPACSLELYHSSYLPVLQGKRATSIEDMTIYNLKDSLEKDDNVAGVYRKSLLYLVSNAFERDKDGKPILGMEKFKQGVTSSGKKPVFIYSSGSGSTGSHSTSHGGFDNDKETMNHILKRILKAKPTREFTDADLKY